jgi:antitoxin CcdA
VSTVHGWLSGARKPDWNSLRDLALATGGAVSAADFERQATAGFREEQAPFRGPASGHGASVAIRPLSARERLMACPAALAAEARALGLDPDRIAASALREAIAQERNRRGAEEHRETVAAWNRWIAEHGLPLDEHRMF